MEFLTTATLALVGKGFLSSAIKETAIGTYHVLYQFVNHPEIDLELQELDIEATIKTVESIIQNITQDQISDPVYLSLHQLHQSMCNIMDDLTKLKQSADNYNKKWFRSIRSADYISYLESVKINSKVLDKRLKHLFKLLNIQNVFSLKKFTYSDLVQNKHIQTINDELNDKIIMYTQKKQKQLRDVINVSIMTNINDIEIKMTDKSKWIVPLN